MSENDVSPEVLDLFIAKVESNRHAEAVVHCAAVS